MYLEDAAWCVIAERKGYMNMFVPESHIWHKNAQSSGGSGSTTHVYYQTRNRILFAKEFASVNTKIAVMREAVRNWRKSEDEIVKIASFDGIIGRTGKVEI